MAGIKTKLKQTEKCLDGTIVFLDSYYWGLNYSDIVRFALCSGPRNVYATSRFKSVFVTTDKEMDSSGYGNGESTEWRFFRSASALCQDSAES
jgi:hypothetical protein